MMTYEKLDAWKSCHALVLAVHGTLRERGPNADQLIHQLCYAALRAAAKLAFGSGSGNRALLLRAAQISAGYLAEFSYHLSLTRVLGLVSEDAGTKLDALRGRASFYTWQLLETLVAPPPADGLRT